MKKDNNKTTHNNKRLLALVITDVHLDRGNSSLVEDVFAQALSLCEERGIKRMICAGDVFTSRSGQPLECLSAWQRIVGLVTGCGIELIVIPGNHDKTDGNDERSYLDVYEGCSPLFTLCRVGTALWPDEDTRIDMIPYFGSEKWLSELERLQRTEEQGETNILITHMAFNGVRNADGTQVSDGIPPSAVAEYDTVLCGHYHDQSTVADNIRYVGSAYQNTYGENITDKGFTLLYRDGSIQFVKSKFPKYIKHTIAATDRETLANLLDTYGSDAEPVDHIRFEFVGTKTELEQLDVTGIQTQYGIDCKFRSTEEREAVETACGEEVLNWDASSVTKDFYRFCAENKIRGAELKYGIGLIKILK